MSKLGSSFLPLHARRAPSYGLIVFHRLSPPSPLVGMINSEIGVQEIGLSLQQSKKAAQKNISPCCTHTTVCFEFDSGTTW